MKQELGLIDTDRERFYCSCEGKEIILFGAGIFAEPAIHSLRQRGIKPTCIWDNFLGMQGKEIFGIPVESPNGSSAAYTNTRIIITTRPKYIAEIRSQLSGMGFWDVYDCAHLLSRFQYNGTTFERGVSQLHFDLDEYIYDYFIKHNPNKIIIPSLDIVITERCSLRCRDCANLMQYYTRPKDLNCENIFSALDVLMECIDHVLEFRVLGGETFVNRNAYQFVERLRNYSNYSRIAIYTNGTIVPVGKNLECLSYEDCFLRISNYGPKSRKLKEMREVFDAHGVTYDVVSMSEWQDCSHIRKRNRTREELEAVFAACCANRTMTLLNGNVYICPFAANADNLGALPAFPHDILNLRDRPSRHHVREHVCQMLRGRAYFSACNYCAGRPIGGSTLPVAIQARKPIPLNRICGRDA
jgi:organic radical activating enzyme